MRQNSAWLIKIWGNLGRRIEKASKKPINPIVLIKSLKAMNAPIINNGSLNKNEIERLLKKSDEQLSKTNLSEPLRLDFAANRFFTGGREEGFSDWLAWLMKQIDSSDLLKLLDVAEPDIIQACESEKPRIDREVPVEEGHDEHTGRIDILIHFEKCKVLINVEIKVTNAEEADLIKNVGYDNSLKRRFPQIAPENRHNKLLVIEAMKDDYDGYKVLTWENLCKELRRIVKTKEYDILFRALCLGLTGAVEQTLLGFSNSSCYNSQFLKYLEKITN